jgi:alginate O-acetyltransferase complex protein AlgI
MFSASLISVPEVFPVKLLAIITLAFVLEGINQKKKFTLDFGMFSSKPAYRWILYYSIILVILFSGGDHQQFVYFNF